MIALGHTNYPLNSARNSLNLIEIAPEYYYVIPIAGQSNAMAYGEGIPLPETLDKPHPRIKQLARRTTVTPSGEACNFNDVIPLDHCPHDVQDMSHFNHPRADLSQGQYGGFSQALHMAKKLLPYLPANAGILVVPCARGGSAFTQGNNGSFDPTQGATETSSRWGIDKPLYQDLIARAKAALDKNPANRLLAVVWMQGESDMSGADFAQQPAKFTEMIRRFRTDMASHTAQIPDFNAAGVPWICGDTTHYWKDTYPAQYDTVYGAYKNNPEPGVYFVPFMTDGHGVNTPTNAPADDPDIPAAGYFGSASRDNENWTSSLRSSHFSSRARRGIVAERLASAILLHAGRGTLLAAPAAPLSRSKNAVSGLQNYTPSVETFSYNGRRGDGTPQTQGWTTVMDGTFTTPANPDGKGGHILNIAKMTNKEWKIEQPLINPADLFKFGGRLTVKFKLTTARVNNQFAFGVYLPFPVASLPAGVTIPGPGKPAALSLVVQTDTTHINLMWHKAPPNIKIGTFGAYSTEWQTMDLVFLGRNSPRFECWINGVSQGGFNPIRTPVRTPDNTLQVTGITTAASYGVEFDALALQVYRDDGTITLRHDDASSYVYFPPGYHGARVIIPDAKISAGNTVQIVANNAGIISIVPANHNVLVNGVPTPSTTDRSVTLVQQGGDGKTWVIA